MEYSWIVFALFSAIFASLVAIFAKMGLQGVDPTIATTLRALIMFVFLLILIIFQGRVIDAISVLSTKKLVFFIILSGIAGAMSWLFYFIAIKQGTVTKVVSIDRLSIVFAMIFSFIFLNEKITLKSGIGVLFITVGAIIIAMDS